RPEFPRFYQQMLTLRRGSSALRRGSLEWLRNSDETRVLSFVRRSSEEEVLIVLNLSSRPVSGNISVSDVSGFKEITPTVAAPQPGGGAPAGRRPVKRGAAPATSLPQSLGLPPVPPSGALNCRLRRSMIEAPASKTIISTTPPTSNFNQGR